MSKKPKNDYVRVSPKNLNDRDLQESMLYEIRMLVNNQNKIKSKIGTIEIVISIVFIVGLIGAAISVMGALTSIR